MRYTIYKTTNLLNGKYYIGKHQTENPNDSYYGSGKALLAAIKLYGKEHFKKEVLFDFDNEAEMNSKEKELITEEFVKSDKTYNMGIGGEGGPQFKGRKHSKETLEKLANAARNKVISEETRKKLSEGNRNRGPISEKGRQKIREAQQRRWNKLRVGGVGVSPGS
jgi:hypothetical protein